MPNRIEGPLRPAREFCVLRLPLGSDGEVAAVMTVENIKAGLRAPVAPPLAAGRR